jgi:hypothetical protein
LSERNGSSSVTGVPKMLLKTAVFLLVDKFFSQDLLFSKRLNKEAQGRRIFCLLGELHSKVYNRAL